MSLEAPLQTKPATSKRSAEDTGDEKASSIAPKRFATPFKELGSVPIGSHIATKRVDYFHQGIVSKVDEHGRPTKVIHLADLPNKKLKQIREQSIELFLGDAKLDDVQVVHHASDAKYTGEEAVRRANSRRGECTSDVRPLIRESFAEWAITDDFDSRTVEAVRSEKTSDEFIANAIRTFKERGCLAQQCSQ
jgi:hypothetical protein